MNVEFSRPIIVCSALMLGLLTTTHIHAQLTTTPDTLTASSSSSYGLLDSFAAPPAAPTPVKPSANHIETSVSLGVAPQLTATRLSDNDSITQSLDPSPAILGTLRQSFRPWLGYSLNLGYTRTTEHNVGTPYAKPSFDVPANMYEVSFAYLAEKHITPRLTAFADLGAGVVTFLPVHRGADAINFVPNNYRSLVPSVAFRPEGVGGVGVEYHLTPSLALRAEYRGLLYKFPDYGGAVPRAITVSSQPTLSLTYTFGKHPRKK